MRVAGIGFRSGAGVASLAEALAAAEAALPGAPPGALATAADKAGAAVFERLAAARGLPALGVSPDDIAAAPATPSAHSPARYGGKSLSEAAALAAAGPGARLLVARVVSSDGQATAAIAEGPDHPQGRPA